MATVEITAAQAGGTVAAQDSVLANVYSAASGYQDTSSTAVSVGVQFYNPNYEQVQLCLQFDTTSTNIPAGATINSATLKWTNTSWGRGNGEGAVFEVYLLSWSGGGLTGADYQSSTDLGSLNSSPGLLAHWTAPGNGEAITEYTFEYETAFASNINTSGNTEVIVVAQEGRTAPTWDANCAVGVYTPYETTASYRPKLYVDYTAAAAPEVTDLSTHTGTVDGGTHVHLTGTDMTGTTAVHFGTTDATDVSVVGSTEVTCTTPAHTAGAVYVKATNSVGEGTGEAAGNTFTFEIPAPTITAIDPTSGSVAGGTEVTITGTHFTDATAVHFGAVDATSFTVDSDTQITAVSPPAS